MTLGVPIISSKTHGIKDYTQNEVTGYCIDRFDIQGFKEGIEKLVYNEELRRKIGKYNQKIVERYDLKNVEKIMKQIYRRNY